MLYYQPLDRMFLETLQFSPFSLYWKEMKPRVTCLEQVHTGNERKNGNQMATPKFCPLQGGGERHKGLRSDSGSLGSLALDEVLNI